MSESTTPKVVFTTGGTVQAGNGTYLTRQADEDLMALCRQSAFAYILTARQMGKSSLMTSAAERLLDEGVKPVIIDLTSIGVNLSAEQWYLGLLAALEDQIELDTNPITWWQAHQHLGMTQRLTLFFQEVLLREVPAPERIVIFVDEIDTTLSLGFTDDFFAAIRYLYNARATNPELQRLSFVLIGVATPGDLIRDAQRTPFNIGQRVELTDFTLDEALPFAAGLQLPPAQARQVLQWVMNWTSGHPYLTQRLCLALIDQHRSQWTEADVNAVVERTFFGAMSEQDNNLQFVRDMLTKRAPGGDTEGVLTTYKEILTRPVPDEEQSLIKSHLKLSGIVRRAGGKLHLRNRIYQTVFDKTWVSQHLPVNWTKQLKRAAYFAAVTLLILNVPLSLYALTQQSRAISKANDLEKANKALATALEDVKKAQREAEEQRQKAETAREEAEQQRDIATEQRKRAEDLQKEAEAASLTATQQRDLARANGQEAEELGRVAYSRELAANSLVNLPNDPELSFALAVESLNVSDTLQTEEALRQSYLLSYLRTNLDGHTDIIITAAFSPDGKQIVTASVDRTARVWDTASGKGVSELRGHTASVTTAAFSPDGKQIVTASGDRTARVWDAASGKGVSELRGHTDSVNTAAFSPDGKQIVTASDDKTARVWDAASGKGVSELRGHTASVTTAAFSPDGKQIVTASADGTARIYPEERFMPFAKFLPLVRARAVRELTDAEKYAYLRDTRRGSK